MILIFFLCGAFASLFPSPNATTTYWLKDARYQNFRSSPDLPAKADVVVIGAGISGVSVVHSLVSSNPKLSIVLLDARGVAAGATGRNSGGIGATPDAGIARQFGASVSSAVAQVQSTTIQKYVEFCSNATRCPGCWIRLGGVLTSFVSPASAASAKEDFDYLNSQGLGNGSVFWPDCAPVVGSPYTSGCAGAASGFGGNIWTSRLVWALLDEVIARVNVQTNTLVKEISSGSSWVVSTDRGSIQAGQVVLATNAYTRQFLPQIPITPVRGQIILSDPVPSKQGWPFDLSMDFGDSYGHWNPDGTLLFGGFREMGEGEQVWNFDDSQISARVLAGLQTILPSMFPSRFEQLSYSMSWTGIMGFTVDGNPFVGPVPNATGLWVCAGFNGGGIVDGHIYGTAVGSWIASGEMPALFSTSSAAGPFYSQALVTSSRLTKR